VPLKPESYQTVVIGAFNPFLISPEWLVKYKVCSDEPLNLRLVTIGVGASFRFGPVSWEVDNQRLIVSSSDPKVDCGALVSTVLKLLPHTPIRAVGHNFHFSAGKLDWGERPSPTLGGRTLEQLGDYEQVRWVGITARREPRIEITLAYESDAVAVLLNHHYTIDLEQIRKAENVEEQIAPAREAAEKFRSDFLMSRELCRSLFQMEIPDA